MIDGTKGMSQGGPKPGGVTSKWTQTCLGTEIIPPCPQTTTQPSPLQEMGPLLHMVKFKTQTE